MFVKNIINNIGKYLYGFDLCSFGTATKNATFLLEPHKLEFFFYECGVDNCYYISLYNIHSNLILFKHEPDFYLDVYLLKYKFINKIVLKAGRHLSIGPKNTILVETNDSHESDYNNMCFNFRDNAIYFHFNRSDYIPAMCQETCKKTHKIVSIVEEQINVRKIITNISLPYMNNSKLSNYLKSALYNRADRYINTIVLKNTQEIVSSDWTRIGKKMETLVLGNNKIPPNIPELVGIRFRHFSLSEYITGEQMPESLKYLRISNHSGMIYSYLPKLPKNLVKLEIDCMLTPHVLNIILKETKTLVHLKKVKIPFLEDCLKDLNKNISSLTLFYYNPVTKIQINRFDNLDYLEIELSSKNTLDLSNHKLRYLICNNIQNAKIIFNNSIIYECIKIRNIEKNNIQNFKTKYLYLNSKKRIVIHILKNVEAWKLEINSNIKIICFPNNITELKLTSMELYSFSDFPDSVEKIYIQYIELNRRFGVFPKALKELTIIQINTSRVYSHLPESRNLIKFFSKDMDFPKGNVHCANICTDVYYCTLYSQVQ